MNSIASLKKILEFLSALNASRGFKVSLKYKKYSSELPVFFQMIFFPCKINLYNERKFH